MILHTEFILYVADQQVSRDFYAKALALTPTLDVPGMTEFTLSPGCVLGLMPASGIAKIISGPLPHPDRGLGLPRCELYLRVADAQAAFERALAAGAREVSPVADRDWGDRVGYLADADGHVIAFAQKIKN